MRKAPGKNVSILGLGKSGFQSALFLHRKGFHCFASDQGASEAILQNAETLGREGVEVETGGHSAERILQSDWVLISPGIPPTSSIYLALRAKGVPVFSEIEVASWYCPSKNIVAVTGSSGKTTVTTLIARVLERSGRKTICCGNIGNPWIGELEKIGADDFVVLELSSFQLIHCETFRPKVGILLNLSPNHQDWHKDMAEYATAKLRIFRNQEASDVAIFRKMDQTRFFHDFNFKGRELTFGEDKTINPNDEVVRKVGALLDCSQVTIEEVLKSFEGIEHRLEKVASLEGVSYVNDSKCTTTASLAWALEKYADKSVVLIAGGHPKSDDFDTVLELIRRKVKIAILIGEARPLLRRAWNGACPFFETNDFREAVESAKREALAGETVLLSPACASFDMFKNYEERGKLFKKYVLELMADIHV